MKMNSKVLQEAFSPWINDVIKYFSESIKSDYGTYILQFLHKNVDEEISIVYSSRNGNRDSKQERASVLFTALTCIYNHFYVKITQQDCPNLEASSVRLLSQIIKTGLMLSRGQPKSEWINRISQAMHLFTGNSVLIIDAVLLVGTLKSKYYQAYLEILKNILTPNLLEQSPTPIVYMKTILLLRRMKALSKDKSAKCCVTTMAAMMKPPADLMVWLKSIFGRDAESLKYKIITKQLLGNKVPDTLIRNVRKMVLRNYSGSGTSSLGPQSTSEEIIYVIDSGAFNHPGQQLLEKSKASEASAKIVDATKNKKPNSRKIKLKTKKLEEKKKKLSTSKSISKATYDYVSHKPLNKDDALEGDGKSEVILKAGSSLVSNDEAVTSRSAPKHCSKMQEKVEEITISDSESPAEKEAHPVAHQEKPKKGSSLKEKSNSSPKKKKSKRKCTALLSGGIIEDSNMPHSDSLTSLFGTDSYSVAKSEEPIVELDQSSNDFDIFYIDTVPKNVSQKSNANESECCISVKKRKSSENRNSSADVSKSKMKKLRKLEDSSLLGDKLLKFHSGVPDSIEVEEIISEKWKRSTNTSIDTLDQNNDSIELLQGGSSNRNKEDKTDCSIAPDNQDLNFSSHSSQRDEAADEPNSSGTVECNQQASISHPEANDNPAAFCKEDQVMFSVFQKSPSWALKSCEQVPMPEDPTESPENLHCSQTIDADPSPSKMDVYDLSISHVTSSHISSCSDADSGVGVTDACQIGETESLPKKGKRKLGKKDVPIDIESLHKSDSSNKVMEAEKEMKKVSKRKSPKKTKVTEDEMELNAVSDMFDSVTSFSSSEETTDILNKKIKPQHAKTVIRNKIEQNALDDASHSTSANYVPTAGEKTGNALRKNRKSEQSKLVSDNKTMRDASDASESKVEEKKLFENGMNELSAFVSSTNEASKKKSALEVTSTAVIPLTDLNLSVSSEENSCSLISCFKYPKQKRPAPELVSAENKSSLDGVEESILDKSKSKDTFTDSGNKTDISTCVLPENLDAESEPKKNEQQDTSPNHDKKVNILPSEIKTVQAQHSNDVSVSENEIPLSECLKVQKREQFNQNVTSSTKCGSSETENGLVQSGSVPVLSEILENSGSCKNSEFSEKKSLAHQSTEEIEQDGSMKPDLDNSTSNAISCELVWVDEDIGTVQVPHAVEIADKEKEDDSGSLKEAPLSTLIKEDSEQSLETSEVEATVKESRANAEKCKKLCLTLHNQINPMKVDETVSEFKRVTRSLSKQISSSGESDRFPFSFEKENYLSFADVSLDPQILTSCSSESISKTLAFSQRLDAKKDTICSTKVLVLKDDNFSQFSEASDDWKSQDLFSDECDCVSEHSCPEAKSDVVQEAKSAENVSPDSREDSLSPNGDDKTQFPLREDACDIGTDNQSTPDSNLKGNRDASDSSHRKSLRLKNKQNLQDSLHSSSLVNSLPVSNKPGRNSDGKDPPETTSSNKNLGNNKKPICLVEKLDIEPCKKSSKRGSSGSATPPKRYCLRHQKSKPQIDESSKLGIDLSTLQLDSPSRKLSLRKYTKMEEKLLTKIPILQSSLSQENWDEAEESGATVQKPSEENAACYNLRNRKSILAPAKLKR